MATITLQPITSDNWRQCAKLKVHGSQQNFVAPNAYSLAEAHYVPNNFPTGIYADDTMVGFLMYGFEMVSGYQLWFVDRLMIAADQQGKGYGEAAMRQFIQQLRTEHDPDGLLISYVPENEGAAKLYAKLGFLNEGTTISGETVVRLPFRGENKE